MSENPFFENWTAPFALPPFDRIRPEHFPPAFDRAMAEHTAEIGAITGSAAAPTFANTIEALERSGQRRRNAITSARNARPRWLTLSFSSSVASPNVFPSSSDRKYGS